MTRNGFMNQKFMHKIILIVFLIVLVAFSGIKIYMFVTTNGKGPTISFDKKEIKVKTSAKDEVLLEGVTAKDEKGNDVTDSIIIEGYSKLLKHNKRKITYIAYDANNNIGKGTRVIKYKNYKSPVIKSRESLEIYGTADNANILTALKCKDCIDGDISNNIQIDSSKYTYTQDATKIAYNVSVTNSAGDTTSMQIPYVIHEVDNPNAYPQVVLNDYIIYAKKGTKFSSRDYIKCVQIGSSLYQISGKDKPKETKTTHLVPNVTIPSSSISYDSEVNMDKAGVYNVRFKVKYNGQKGYSTMIVVVED